MKLDGPIVTNSGGCEWTGAFQGGVCERARPSTALLNRMRSWISQASENTCMAGRPKRVLFFLNTQRMK